MYLRIRHVMLKKQILLELEDRLTLFHTRSSVNDFRKAATIVHVNTKYGKTALNNVKLSVPSSWTNSMSSRSSSSSSSQDSICRQNFQPECEAAINEQINQELHASFVYLSMAYYFNRDDVALAGFYKYFKKSSEEEREHAESLMKYQNERGGRIIMKSITKPEKDDWGSPADAIKAALNLERKLNQALLNLHGIAEKHKDPHLTDYLEDCLDEQVKAIKELADYLTNLKRVGVGVGEYVFDKEEFSKL